MPGNKCESFPTVCQHFFYHGIPATTERQDIASSGRNIFSLSKCFFKCFMFLAGWSQSYVFFLFQCFDLLVINPEIIFYLLSDTIRQKMSDCFVFPSSPPHYLCDTITHRISSDLLRHPHFFQRPIQRFRRWTHLTFQDLCDHNDHDDHNDLNDHGGLGDHDSNTDHDKW